VAWKAGSIAQLGNRNNCWDREWVDAIMDIIMAQEIVCLIGKPYVKNGYM